MLSALALSAFAPSAPMGKNAQLYAWIQGGYVSTIALDTNHHMISWNGGPFHGQWSYMWDPQKDIGTFKIIFHCKADEGRMKEHIFTQVKGTGVYHLGNAYMGAVVLAPMEQ